MSAVTFLFQILEVSQENKRYQENISCKDGVIKDRNGRDLTEAEDIKKRWQEYKEKLDKKNLHDPDIHDGVITLTHLEPDILECKSSGP